MSWQTFQQDAFNLTDKEIKRLTKAVLQQYRDAEKAITAQLKKIYLNTLSGVKPDDYYKVMLQRDRLNNLLKQIKAEYSKFSISAGVIQKQIANVAFSNVYYRKLYASQWITGKAVFGLLPKNLIELTILGTEQAWKNIRDSKFGSKLAYVPQKGSLLELLGNNRTKEIANIRTAITQSLINKQGFGEAVNNIRRAIGQEKPKFDKNGVKIGTKFTGAKSNALRIIRTETNRIQNMGSYAASKELESEGIDVKRSVIAVPDNKTRPQSIYTERNNKKIGVDEPIKYPNGITAMTPGTTGVDRFDINDRETVIDIIDGESPKIRRGRNPVTGKNEVFEYKDFDQWAKDNNLTKNYYGQVVAK